MADQPGDEITTGMWVKLTGFVPGEEEVFHLVSDAEADVMKNKIPSTSPLARALEGARVGEKVTFHPPGGEVELTILEAGPL